MATLILIPALGLALGLAFGCDEQDGARFAFVGEQNVHDDDAFAIGQITDFVEPKVYTEFRKTHDLWVVSDGRWLFVLHADCPGGHGQTFWDDTSGKFYCPKDGSRFDRYGLKWGRDTRAPHSMARARIDLVDGEIRVSPNRRYVHEKDQWSSPFSMLELPDNEPKPLLD